VEKVALRATHHLFAAMHPVTGKDGDHREQERSRRNEDDIAVSVYGRIFLYALCLKRRRRTTSRFESTSTFSTFSAALFANDVTTK